MMGFTQCIEKILGCIPERKAECLTIVTLGTQSRAIHVQIVSIGTRICRSRPPVAVRALTVQVTTTPVVVAGEYIRKRILAGFGGAGGVLGKDD